MEFRFSKLFLPLVWAVDLVLPPECTWCLTPIEADQSLCPKCLAILSAATNCCLRCAMPLPTVVDRTSCLRCRDQGWQFERAVALGPYRGRLREAILLMKKPTYEALATAAGHLLAQRLVDEKVAFDLVVPVPNHWSRRLTHRTSTAETLASAIAANCHRPISLNVVKRVRRTQKQGMLAWSNRTSNVQRAFRVTRPRTIAGKRLLLVDDVFTSGATAAELSRCLLKSGASLVSIAVAARGTGTRDIDPHSP